jgi:hypothetical protein
MFELLKTSVTGVNLIPTVLLGLAVLYWLTVIIGALDIDLFDIDIDIDADVDLSAGPFHGILIFFNVGDLPVMFVFSVLILVFWVLSMLVYLLPIETGGVVSAILLVPNFVLSAFITKIITNPLKGLFKGSYKNSSEAYKVEGKVCTLLCSLSYGGLGQAEIVTKGAPIIINVKQGEDEELQKGDKVLVISKDAEKNFYIVKKFEGVK